MTPANRNLSGANGRWLHWNRCRHSGWYKGSGRQATTILTERGSSPTPAANINNHLTAGVDCDIPRVLGVVSNVLIVAV